ncbi:AlwI family type II restriction endonuclease [Candidatus Enterococcus leclercqii]|uniref:AlwI family type II restriction endonuclease n=1 Tax=Candidatus Enterococcus leclercqii TaxID=1857218 RepID=UPI00137A2ADC|nr:AlwI family type II restriction endonuclease [Enterococcus sp. CU9D]KAF1293543.1 hypothetical protein BAU14_02195 [Enterococcus sp. CU9D]
MAKVMWGFGNTTVRNPNRISSGLNTLLNSQYNGNIIGVENEAGFAKVLGDGGVIALSEKSDIDSSGRKWRSCFSQLGFITHKFSRKVTEDKKDGVILKVVDQHPELNLSGNPYQITPQGYRLATIEHVSEAQDVMLRALLCYELPSAVQSLKDVKGKFKPFVFVLQVLKRLMETDNETRGLSTSEMVALQAVYSHDEIDNVIEKIIEHRKKRDKVEGKVKKSRVDREFRENILKTYGLKVKEDSANTYAERNFRYLRATGLFSRKGRGITLNLDKKLIIDSILATEPTFAVNEEMYLYHLWNGYPIPTDDKKVLIEEIIRLSKYFDESINRKQLLTEEVPLLQQKKIRMESQKAAIDEEDYAVSQKTDENIKEIIDYLDVINGKRNEDILVDDKPAYLEWAVWRAFLSINNLRNKPYHARRFKIDQDFYPVGTAPGNGPDIIFEFEDYVLVVEVTLTSSSRQEAAEGEPVRRHIAVEKDNYDKPVYGLFIAGSIDNNTAETFRIGVWYHGDVPDFINIVPMTLEQFIGIMTKFQSNQFSNEEFRLLLDRCLLPRNAHAPLWKKEINKEISSFVEFV